MFLRSGDKPRVSGLLFLAVLSLIGAPAAYGQVTAEAPAERVMTLASFSDSMAAVAKKAGPAVVSIDAKARPAEMASRDSQEVPDDILEFFRRQMPTRPATAIGSGFIVDPSGYIVTNAHVVENAVKITVRLDSGEEHPAELIGLDDETDIAVLKVNIGQALPYLRFGNSENVRVGDWVLAIGSPFGLNRTVTAGIVSQTRRETAVSTPFQRFIQTDAAINRGNSGGPLVDLKGDVIGVNSQIATSTGDYNGVGFALPAIEARQVYEEIRANGKVQRGYLGVYLDSVKTEFAKVYGLGETRGAIITDVRDEDGPAAAAGLETGDIVIVFDGQEIKGASDLIEKVAATRPESDVQVTFLREVGDKMERRSVEMTLGERTIGNARLRGRNRPAPVEPPVDATKPFGLTLTEVSPAMATSLKLEGGLVVREINPASFIADVKLSNGVDALGRGDIIIRINRQAVTDQATFTKFAAGLKPGDPVVLHVLSPVPGGSTAILKYVQFTVQ